jgi:cytochrome P450
MSQGERRDLTPIMPGGKDNPLLAGRFRRPGSLMVSFVMPASHCASSALDPLIRHPLMRSLAFVGAGQRVSRERLVVAGHLLVAGKVRRRGRGELVDGAGHAHELDVVSAISQVLPTLVISDLLDIDPSLRQDFQRWTAAYMKSFALVLDDEQLAALREMQKFFADTIAERRRVPGTDLISAAVTAEMEGMHLTDRDLLQFANLLLIAGSETTTHLITNTVLCVQQHPDLADRIRRDPAVLPAVIDEVLRYLSPVQTAPRATDITMYDHVIPAGSMVFPWLGAANRDPDEFDEPDTFSIDRKRGKHLAFGHGIHFCLGAALARLETEIVLTTMLARLPGRWDVPDMLRVFPAQEMCGLVSLPLQWGRAAANGS